MPAKESTSSTPGALSSATSISTTTSSYASPYTTSTATLSTTSTAIPSTSSTAIPSTSSKTLPHPPSLLSCVFCECGHTRLGLILARASSRLFVALICALLGWSVYVAGVLSLLGKHLTSPCVNVGDVRRWKLFAAFIVAVVVGVFSCFFGSIMFVPYDFHLVRLFTPT